MRCLELGCISPSEPGWETLDIRPGATYTQSAVDLSNFEDDAFDRVKSRDMIEHLGWREVPAALKEWLRIGKVLEIETPNAVELEHLLRGFYTDSAVGEESQWEHFCRVAYGHQDYPENSHRCYFTPRWLEELLYEAGAREVWTIYAEVLRFQLGASK